MEIVLNMGLLGQDGAAAAAACQSVCRCCEYYNALV